MSNEYPRHATEDTANLDLVDPEPEPVTAEGVDLDDDPFADDLSDRLAAKAPRQYFTRATLVLASLVLLVGGFLAGALVQKTWGKTSTTSNSNNPFANLAGGRGASAFPGGNFPGGATASASSNAATTGTVKLVDGNTVYITTADGNTVIVHTSGSTAVQVAQNGKLTDIKTGATVTVDGTTGSDGSVTASKITKTK
jgi:Cu/Ag efflux protein CusF